MNIYKKEYYERIMDEEDYHQSSKWSNRKPKSIHKKKHTLRDLRRSKENFY